MKAKKGVRSAVGGRSKAEPCSNRTEHSAPNTIHAEPRAQNTVKAEPIALCASSFGLKEFIQGLAIGVLIGVLVTLIIR